jgi:hypothetical protein
MTSIQAILTGAALIAASIVFMNGIRPAEAQRLSGGPYQLMHHSNTVANAGVFRLDTASGEISYCYVTGNSDLTCTRTIK